MVLLGRHSGDALHQLHVVTKFSPLLPYLTNCRSADENSGREVIVKNVAQFCWQDLSLLLLGKVTDYFQKLTDHHPPPRLFKNMI